MDYLYVKLRNPENGVVKCMADRWGAAVYAVRSAAPLDDIGPYKPVVRVNQKPEVPEGKFLAHMYVDKGDHVEKSFHVVSGNGDLFFVRQADYEQAVQDMLDMKARELGYDNTYTCISYAESTVDKFRSEARSMIEWRDRVWTKCHEILNAYTAGSIAQPTIVELVAMMPPFPV